MKLKNFLCLAIDTASDLNSVAVLLNGKTLSVRQLQSERGQGEVLFSLIQEVLAEAKKTPADLTHIVVSVGPGSFTGVRIGLATARALGLALKIPVLGVNNFNATAWHNPAAVTVVLDTKRSDYFTQTFDKNGHTMSEPSIQTSEQLQKNLPFIAIGSGANKLANQIPCATLSDVALAINLGQIAYTAPDLTIPPHPFYLKDADVTL